jgi:mono/diheme cytochrome c family protein
VKIMNKRFVFGVAAVLSYAVTAVVAGAADTSQVARGRYLVTIGGCNDCHTAGFMQEGMKIAEKDWLKGNQVGFQGPWGTSYPANLRLVINSMNEAQWLKHARQDRMPPMPAYVLQQMKEDDLKAIYAYVKSLGDPGVAAPAYVAPGGKVNTPYFVFVPQVDQKAAALAK